MGEQRTVKWSPAGLHFGDEVDLDAFLQARGAPHARGAN